MIKLRASIRTNDFNVPNHLHNYFLTAETAAVPKAGTVSRPLAGLISAIAWLRHFRRGGCAQGCLSALSIALAILTLTAAQAAGDIIAHWDFNETGGDIARSSVGGQQGQMYGGASFVTEGGIEGGALSLERDVNSYVDTGPWFDFVDRDFSLQAWVRTNPGDTSDLFVVGQHNSGSLNGIILFVNGINPVERRDGSAGFYASARQQDVLLSGTDVNDGNWHQLVSVYRVAGNVELYVDGANLEGSALAQTINPNTASFLIGGITFGSTPGGGFDGLIDEVQVYDYALAAHEIQFLYENPGLALGDSRTPGDTDADGDVDLEDLNLVRNNFGAFGDGVPGDANGDGKVDLGDLNDVRNNFGTAGAAAVPEPGTFCLASLLAAGAMFSWRRFTAFAVGVAFLTQSGAAANALEFRFLGDYPVEHSWSVPTSIANQGDFVMGDAYSVADRQWGTFAWSKSQGIGSPAALGLPTGTMRVSADGDYFVGAAEHNGGPEKFLWSAATGTKWLGKLPGAIISYAFGVSDDGNVVVGFDNGEYLHPTVWTPSGGMRELATPPGFGGVAFAVTEDGATIVGKLDLYRQQAVRWTTPSTYEYIPDIPGATDSWASDASSDGSRVVGYMSTGGLNHAFLWDESTGTTSLFDNHPAGSGFARAISGDGNLVGGTIDGHAFLWSTSTGLQLLEVVLASQGVDVGECRLEEVGDISRNGRFVTGAAACPTGYQGYLVDLYPPLSGDTDADGDVDLDDVNNVRNTFGATGDQVGDANDDGVVDLDDLNDVRNNFGTVAGAATVPEPASASLIVLGGMACVGWLRGRRRYSQVLIRSE